MHGARPWAAKGIIASSGTNKLTQRELSRTRFRDMRSAAASLSHKSRYLQRRFEAENRGVLRERREVSNLAPSKARHRQGLSDACPCGALRGQASDKPREG